MAKRVFSKATGEITRSIRITKDMEDAITKLSEDYGVTINAYITMALDEYLQSKAEAGSISWPKGHDVKSVNARRKS